MKLDNSPAYPCSRNDTASGMTYRQHLIAQLAPIALDAFFNHDAWNDYGEMAKSLINAVDSIIEAEQELGQ